MEGRNVSPAVYHPGSRVPNRAITLHSQRAFANQLRKGSQMQCKEPELQNYVGVALPFISRMTLGKSPHFSEPWFLHTSNGGNTYSVGL